MTLGVYHFWGRTEVRQRIWSAVRIDGEPLEYRGTGGELFRGFLIVFAVVLVPLTVIGLAPLLLGPSPAIHSLYHTSLFVLVVGLSGLGIFRARRYRLSRTRWRGIRSGLAGRSMPYAWTYLWSTLLIPLTLGWIIPWRAATLQRALFNATYFGDKAFAFHGRSGPLYKRFRLVWVSAILLFLVAFTAMFTVYLAPIIGQSRAPDAPPPRSPHSCQRAERCRRATRVRCIRPIGRASPRHDRTYPIYRRSAWARYAGGNACPTKGLPRHPQDSGESRWRSHGSSNRA